MVYLILALVLYTMATLFGASASRNLNTNLVAVIANVLSAAVPLAVIIPSVMRGSLHFQKYGVVMAVLGGASVGLFVMAINKSFTLNKVGIVTPVVFGGTILLTTILSYFLFKEKITPVELIGLSLVLAGILLIIYARATVSS